jgi:hypothetical protein
MGKNDYEGRVNIKGIFIISYLTWRSMLERCYSPKSQLIRPTYIGCSVCDEWLIFSNFKEWFDVNYIEGFHLDKDILVEGNKIYSPFTCVFVPQYINSLLTDRRNARGVSPLGVRALKPTLKGRKNTTYESRCLHTINGETSSLTKTFKTVEEASAWYSVTKAMVVREVAQRALDAGDIKQDIFNALVSRKF